MLRRPIAVLGIVVLLVIAGFIIFNIPWGGSNETKQIVQEVKLVESAESDQKVRMIQSGAIVANDEHREIWITVGRYDVTFEAVKGYTRKIINSKKFSNTPESYRAFLAALTDLNFTKERIYKGTETELGSCPSGQRIIFDIFTPTEEVEHTWGTTCSSKIGNFGGEMGEVRSLFREQVPGYNELVADIDL